MRNSIVKGPINNGFYYCNILELWLGSKIKCNAMKFSGKNRHNGSGHEVF